MLALLLLLQFAYDAVDPGGTWEIVSQVEGTQPVARLGRGALLGDLNYDGCADYLLGAPEQMNGAIDAAGAIYLIDGKTSTILFEFNGTVRFGKFGTTVCLIGDLNHDSVPEFGASAGKTDPGQVGARVFSGSDGAVLYQLVAPASSVAYGESMDGIGDWDGDGTDDFAISDDWFNQGSNAAVGAIYVYSGLDASLIQRIDGVGPYHHLGREIRGGGDVNGDGTPDLISMTNFVSGGSVDVLEGGTGTMLYRLISLTGNGYFGSGLDIVADLDLDNCDELLVGAPQAGSNSQGEAYLFSGSSGSLMRTWKSETGYQTYFGQDVAWTGDLNQDGAVDVAIGMPGSLNPGDAGRVFVYSGRDGHLLQTITSNPDSQFARVLDGGMDVNGDGRPDLLVTDDLATVNGTRGNGAAYVFSFRPFLESSTHQISASVGATVDFGVNFPVTEAGLSYRLLASTDQIGDPDRVGKPWIKVHGVSIPLVETALTHRMWNQPPAIFTGAQGRLNPNGNAFIRLRLAPGAAASEIGRSFRFAAVTIDNSGRASLSSAAVLLTIEP